ncbi:AMP-binding protein [Eggerthella sinensis]|uniref:AMP-binding protein n=1 Tax=Eggerthella sinensis TaxID=242230 RepID=UPI00266C9DD8|nr:AMP-binding protein [Eggerthella sinensis]
MAQYNVVEPFLESVRAHLGKTAVVFNGCEITYGALNDRINQMVGVLTRGMGVRPGDRVAYLLPNCPEILEVYYAIQKIGAVAVPLNFKLIPREVSYLVNASGASVLVFAAQFAAAVMEAAASFTGTVALASTGGAVPGALALEPACLLHTADEPPLFRDEHALSRIQYTGGSTGLPKGAARTHAADLVELDAIMDSNGIGDDPDNVVLIQCPLEHHGGHSWFTITFAAGATLVICEAFNAEQILHFIDYYRVTYMILLPPTTYLRLLRCPTIDQYDLSSVRLVQSAAGATTKPIIEAIYDKFPNAVLNYGWGQSESGAGSSLRITRAMLAADSPLLESVGRPMKHVEMKVVDEAGNELLDGEVGEALFRSDATMQGYYGQPDLTDAAFAPDGWLRTGDLMERDARGYFYVRSRKKDMIKSGGENVFVAEVENVLRTHPAIDDCLVFGTSDPVMGEAVAAVIQPLPGSNLTAAEVQSHCKRSIASYKKPRYVVFMDDLGRDSAGKVRKQHIVDYFNERKEQAAPRHHEKIASDPDIYLIQVPYSGGTPIGYTNAYLIATDERNLLVDTGVSHEASFEVLRSALQDLRVDMGRTDVFATHFHIDHLGLIAALAHENTRVYLSARDEELFHGRGARSYRGTVKDRLASEGFPLADLDELEQTDASLIPRAEWPMPERFVNLADGEEMRYGPYRMRAVSTPGHTPGHQCLYLPDQRIMFYGDHVLMNSSPNMAPFPGEPDALGDYLESLEKVARLPVEFACMGHGFVDPRRQAERMAERVAWLRRHHQQRLDEIIACVREHPGIDGTELAKSITWNIPHERWEDIPIIQRWIIVCETLAHLDHLMRAGRLRRVREDDAYRYFAS